MLKNRNLKILMILTFALSLPAVAFDLEDYATTYRATRDAYLKAANELKLASGPYAAAQEAYIQATLKYNSSLGTPDEIRVAVDGAKNKKKCLDEYKSLRDEYYAKFKK